MAEETKVWLHSDARGIERAVEDGRARALSRDWQSATRADRLADFLGWLAGNARAQGLVAGRVGVAPERSLMFVSPAWDADTPEDHRDVARGLYRSLRLLGASAAPDLVETKAGGPAEVGSWPLAVAAIGVATVQAAAIGYTAWQAAQLVDRELARRADLRELVARDAAVQEHVERHVEREKEAGKRLPLDAATEKALGGLLEQQKAIIGRQRGPQRSGFEGLGDKVPNLGSVGGGLLLGLGLATVAALYLTT